MRYLKLFCLCIFITSCQPSRLEYALKISDSNRSELEKVLSHYQKDPLKLQAAVFLIENMPRHFRFPSELDDKYHSLYEKHRLISEKYNWGKPAQWYKEIDSLWKADKTKYYLPQQQPDIRTITAEYLIREIDLAFKGWQENEYTKNCSFQTFCQSILPYRMLNGIIADDSRSVFYNRHKGFFCDTIPDFRDKVDSLLIQYSFLKHNDFAAAGLPIYSASAFEQIKRGLCDVRAWYNTLLLSSLGMPVSYDFIPVWGNRGSAHGWNAIIMNNETHPFEPFWDNDRWKYKRIYNNKNIDINWGKFRLPKVYRHTFESYSEGPIADKRVNINDIPPFFRDIFMKDVSTEYFEPTDVTIPLENIKKEVYYCYLCIFQASGFRPAQWGKIEDGKATFKGMGRDIVYFPMFYTNGTFSPAAKPFLINGDGQYEEIKKNHKKQQISVRMINSHMEYKESNEARKLIKGSFLIGRNNVKDDTIDTLLHVHDSLYAFNNHFPLTNPKPYRYITLSNLPDTFGLCDISFYGLENGQDIRIPDVRISALLKGLRNVENIGFIADGLSATGFHGYFTSHSKEIVFDLGKEYLLSAISIEPYLESYLSSSATFELFYWDDRWVSVGKQNGNDSFLTFDSVPEGTVYQLRRPNWSNIRIFTYDSGRIDWR